MPKTYFDHVKSGAISAADALTAQKARTAGRSVTAATLPSLPAVNQEAYAFGMLDAMAVRFVEWYGPAAAGEVMKHYAAICERQGRREESQ